MRVGHARNVCLRTCIVPLTIYTYSSVTRVEHENYKAPPFALMPVTWELMSILVYGCTLHTLDYVYTFYLSVFKEQRCSS